MIVICVGLGAESQIWARSSTKEINAYGLALLVPYIPSLLVQRSKYSSWRRPGGLTLMWDYRARVA
jgi:hypothetical protein